MGRVGHAPSGSPAQTLEVLVAARFGCDRRVLLLGSPGSPKGDLAAALTSHLTAQGRRVHCLAADPGLPPFGAPGAVCLGQWSGDTWSLSALEALCTLDAARFRLPLASAVRTLAREVGEGVLLVDAPGVVRGVAGAELLESLVEAAALDLILLLLRDGEAIPLADELAVLNLELAAVAWPRQGGRLGSAARGRERTRLWGLWLADAETHELHLDGLRLVGTPPRRTAEAWRGKQVAFLEQGRTLALGEVIELSGAVLRVRLPRGQTPTGALLVRDACRGEDGLLGTSKPFGTDQVHYVPPPDVLADADGGQGPGVRPVVQVGSAAASLVNGVFGDPLLHLRLRHQRRSLLFDLGEGGRLPARIAHQVTDCFITHAHADHIGGFLWLLRSRIGVNAVCRLYGPPGLADHVSGLIAGILWDRIGDRGPVFEVSELRGERLHRVRLQAGRPEPVQLPGFTLEDSVLLKDVGFRVRCALLDHGTPVLAFAFEQELKIQIRKERLLERGLAPGPWLTRLKQRILGGEYGAKVMLPDGRTHTVADLATDLTLSGPGGTLVYATDLGDTPDNRRRLIDLAQGADCLLCEASFLAEDQEQARRTGHLTARACGEIAAAAGVRYLIPFHLSRRYESEPRRVYDEIAAVCPQVVIPKGVRTSPL